MSVYYDDELNCIYLVQEGDTHYTLMDGKRFIYIPKGTLDWLTYLGEI